MPVFISYSHANSGFVDKLALQLVQRNVNVWLDRWELSLGDSIIDKIQNAVDGASALLVILSKDSVASEWCKKELSAGLLRELEEKRVVVMPVMLEDCDVPVFARGKLFADFRKDFDLGLQTVVEGIAKVTNPSLSRITEPTYHVDWSIDWGNVNGQRAIILNFIQLPIDQPYSILINVEILANPTATEVFERNAMSIGLEKAKLHTLKALNKNLLELPELKSRIPDEGEHVERLTVYGVVPQETYEVRIGTRRLGEDTGRDVLVKVAALLCEAEIHMTSALCPD